MNHTACQHVVTHDVILYYIFVNQALSIIATRHIYTSLNDLPFYFCSSSISFSVPLDVSVNFRSHGISIIAEKYGMQAFRRIK